MELKELILNVDDYSPGRYVRTKVLQQSGFSVIEAATGQETILKAVEQKPSLILLDVNLPDMSGFEVCKHLREDPATASITIVHISASSTQAGQQVEGLDRGADCYLVEPVDSRVLVATLRAFLRARQAETALRRSNEELELYAYRVAHDLNEPLRTLIIHSQLAERRIGSAIDPDARQSLQFVVEAAKRMQSFVDDLLQYANVTHGARPVAKVDGEELLSRAMNNLETAIRAAGATVTHDPLPELLAQPGLDEVFQNLIGNAIKYRRPDAAPEIHVSGRFEGRDWLFSVRDNGIGIDSRYRLEIFQLFRRLHGKDVAGTGIGLAVSKKIVEAHGGMIWVESEPGVGSTFYFTIPAEPPLAWGAPTG
jgi:two-component system, sensor histidine kinase and response regulator